jgi:hypothetical protein
MLPHSCTVNLWADSGAIYNIYPEKVQRPIFPKEEEVRIGLTDAQR